MDPSPFSCSRKVRRKLTVMVTVQYRTEHFQSAKITLDVSPAGGSLLQGAEAYDVIGDASDCVVVGHGVLYLWRVRTKKVVI